MLVVAADPIEEFRSTVRSGNLHSIMHKADADALLCERAENFLVVLLYGGMSTTAIGVDHHGSRTFKGILDVGPAVGVNGHAHALHPNKALLEKQAAGAELVHAGRMARPAG